jgi:hypothetical protein
MLTIINIYKARLVFCLALITFNSFLFSQNLILNPGFEDYYPDYTEKNELVRSSYLDTLPAIFWYDFNNGTPDYLNKCDILPGYYPFQVWRKMHPDLYSDKARYDGQAAMGICAYNVTGGIEHITGRICSQLAKDSIYAFCMDISLVDFSYLCLKEIGVLFTKDHPNELKAKSEFYDEIFKIPLESSININISSLSNSDTILKVQREYKASGGEQYITIGLFYQKDYDLVMAMDKFRWIQSKSKKYEKKVLKKYSETPVYKINRKFKSNDLGLAKQAYYVIDNVILTLK